MMSCNISKHSLYLYSESVLFVGMYTFIRQILVPRLSSIAIIRSFPTSSLDILSVSLADQRMATPA